MPSTTRIAAFFDLDRTLLTVNSGALWVARQRREGRLAGPEYLEALAYLLGYRLNVIDITAAVRRALMTIKGETESSLRQRTRSWYFQEVADKVAPGARQALAAHREAGHLLVLLSTTSPYAAELVREHLSLDAVLHSSYEVRDGVFTGEPLLPLCYGVGKRELAERFAQTQRVVLEESFFYSDSASDLPMLRRVGNPRAVNPDLRLWLHARRHGWPVLRWNSLRANCVEPLPGL